eukprot:TRINITY_DN67851_c7_g1_i1.p1 TRINITY_DN67851_c7_g1~~TRINITY_DN67851_c7_g1_i1.p1  ORF type:complete len:233 (+),score=10.89 TRINITY_DN67851_c7_g1_i1:41-739(+)
MDSKTVAMFAEMAESFEKMNDIKENIRTETKALERLLRDLTTTLLAIHAADANVTEICQKAKGAFPSVNPHIEAIMKLVPKDEYYRYNDMWRWTNQQMCYLSGLYYFLQWLLGDQAIDNPLITPQQVRTIFEIKSEAFQIDLEEYLHGLCGLPSELSRYTLNCVIKEDYETPMKISQFVSSLFNSFRLLNLKNDSLRKRYDGIKYDLKNIEQVVYDLRIRKLAAGAVPMKEG